MKNFKSKLKYRLDSNYDIDCCFYGDARKLRVGGVEIKIIPQNKFFLVLRTKTLLFNLLNNPFRKALSMFIRGVNK